MTQLVWFRNDLRLADNPALTAALQGEAPVEACFLLTPEQWRQHDWSPARTRFLLDNLDSLFHRLSALGIRCHLLRHDDFSASPDALLNLSRARNISGLHFNEEYGVNERRRDRDVRHRLTEAGIQVHRYRDQSVVPVGQVLTQQSAPYTVFTPFSRRWRSWLDEFPVSLYPEPSQRGPAVDSPTVPRDMIDANKVPDSGLTAGENAAHQQLEQFLDERGGTYKRDRDFPALAATSRLSPYLAAGVLSGRQCLVAAQQALSSGGREEGIASWVNEVAWRDFYIHILYHFPRVSMHRAFKPETESLPWNPPGEAFEAWKAGQTGVPIVDAAMRQLNQTGWMHNRLRMVTAMFLTKNLFIDWRLGEAYFMSRLVDGFLASNNGGWQWSASTGTDAAPYFRIFNPVSQSTRFDPDGSFIRHYVPEVAKLGPDRIHAPWEKGGRVTGYPAPLVDLKASRQAAIEHFRALQP
ncbi:deoxyribodipyrimidine photo-lyase [Mangrovitalea sediminis]|uniref:deoxyribodipyrimidine photo-lyase n=1 Tax=Mangrovitalea sediminis TaxID=1982043 RepID=UPI000BE62548|nr:deoxyribodipyrimidine photo-lyase [Mangrovitalea sediminis]